MRKIFGIGETIYDILFRNGKPVAAVPGGSVFNGLISMPCLPSFNILCKSLCLFAVFWRRILQFSPDSQGSFKKCGRSFFLISISGYTYGFFCISMIFYFFIKSTTDS